VAGRLSRLGVARRLHGPARRAQRAKCCDARPVCPRADAGLRAWHKHPAARVAYATVRTLACGFAKSTPPDDVQMREIKARVSAGMEEGAVGLSTGLDYINQCHATTEEIAAACTAIVPYGGLYVTHVRYKIGLLPALRE